MTNYHPDLDVVLARACTVCGDVGEVYDGLCCDCYRLQQEAAADRAAAEDPEDFCPWAEAAGCGRVAACLEPCFVARQMEAEAEECRLELDFAIYEAEKSF